jgi:hypothetical protein
MLLDREKAIKSKMEELEIKKAEEVLTQTNQVALQALQKEMNLEQLIKHEEDELEEREEKQMLFQIEEEKKKKECLAQKIKEKALENQYNMRAKEMEKEATKVKDEVAQQILLKRSQLNEMLKKQREHAKRKKMQLKQKLQDVRSQMAEEMTKASRKGDATKCQKSIDSPVERKAYCNLGFADDFANYSTCNEGSIDEFCTMCCDNEFGEFYENDRNECYKKVCTKAIDSPIPIQNDPNSPITNGRWVWQETISPKI